jgi:hypothetical protein
MLDDLQMAGFVGKTATNARSAAASRVLVAGGGGWKTQSRSLPSAARRRSLRSGSVPAVSPPALHFSARRTADRSQCKIFGLGKSMIHVQSPLIFCSHIILVLRDF